MKKIKWITKTNTLPTIHENISMDGVPYLTFPILEKYDVRHGFSTRLGGVSEGDCATMNLSFHRGDNRSDVMENHRLFAAAVGYDEKNLVLSDQIHDTVIRRVDASDCGKGIIRDSDIIGVDGLMTDDENVVLMTFFADCVPLFFYDKKNRSIAASHSGWRGTVARMGEVTVEHMREEFGTVPEDIVAVIGPSICRLCYEVSEDVAEDFMKEFKKIQWSELLSQSEKQKEENKYQLDLWRANELVLKEAGIPEEQIQTSNVCTCCNPEILFSHRASHGKRGNLAGVITLGGIR